MKKFTEIGQFRNVIHNVKSTHDYQGKDENGDAIYLHKESYPKLKFRGTVKAHGTNSAICKYINELNIPYYSFQSRERELSLTQDNAGFMAAMLSKDYQKLFDNIEFNESCVIYGEWAGCFSYQTPILLSDGTTMPIGKIVNQKLAVEVMSYNFDSGILEPKKIINWYNNGKTDDWLKINIQRRKRGGKSTGVTTTPNHKFFVIEDNIILEKFASELKCDDKLITNGKVLAHNIKQFLMGTILGDGSFLQKNIITISHSDDKQKHYNDFIEENFSNIFTKPRTGISGHGSNMKFFSTKAFPEITDLYDELHLNNSTSKQVTVDYLNKLSPLALAVWYMDDGSIINHNGRNRQYRCNLHCQGFGRKNVELIKDWFNSHGYYCNISNTGNNNDFSYDIRFTVEGAASFLYTIAPYVITSFNYKLPTILQQVEKITWWKHYLNDYDKSIIEANILDIESYTPVNEWLKVKYDIEVEDNHNYFANYTLVHNSSIQKGVAIAQLPKMFIIFAVRIDGAYQDIENFKHLMINDQQIYNILQFKTYEVEVDFNQPELAQNRIVELTLEVEDECPIGKYFGVSGVGEGLVFSYYDDSDNRYTFKSKGLKHSNSKVKVIHEVDTERITALRELADEVTPSWRLSQMLTEACDLLNGGYIDRKKMGDYMKMVITDVVKEDIDIITDAGFELKDVAKYISEIAKQYFFDEEKNEEHFK